VSDIWCTTYASTFLLISCAAGRYQILERMNSGQKSAVLKAMNKKYKLVAIKFFASKEMWGKEKQMYAALRSAFVPVLEDDNAGTPTTPPYIVMELGVETLKDWIFKHAGSYAQHALDDNFLVTAKNLLIHVRAHVYPCKSQCVSWHVLCVHQQRCMHHTLVNTLHPSIRVTSGGTHTFFCFKE
jgi:hypothetical protein